jgi:hypothetical protein
VSRLSRQCGFLNISQTYRPPWTVTVIAFTFRGSFKSCVMYIVWILLSIFCSVSDDLEMIHHCSLLKVMSPFIGLWQWYINITITILDITDLPVFYLKARHIGDWILCLSVRKYFCIVLITHSYFRIILVTLMSGACGTEVVKALCYNPEGCRF